MRILIVNGSPKGEGSITLQTCYYLQKRYPAHTFAVLHAAQRIAAFEKDFSEARVRLEQAELILFSYPVYTFLVPSQLHRFIELIKENGVDLSGKICTQVSTSKHFYDVTAHAFIEDNARDLGMHIVKGLSADMDDLLTESGRADADAWFNYLLFQVENGLFEPNAQPTAAYKPVAATVPSQQENAEKTGDVVIVADLLPEDTRLAAMIERFRAVCPKKTRLINIREFPFRGGCISCFRCASTGKCTYPDGFDTFLRENIQQAQGVVLAFTVRDHSMGSRFKMYDDRQFCNGHRTVTMVTPFGYLVSGPLSAERNLDTVLRARAEVGGNLLAGIATDERNPDAETDALAKKLCYAIDRHITQPKNFYGVGGMKIFRDLIWTMQGLMRADHKFFKAHGQYDFPQRNRGTMLKMYLVGWLMNGEAIRKKASAQITQGMIGPYAKVVEAAEPAEREKQAGE